MAEFGLQKNTLTKRSIFALITATMVIAIGVSGCGKKGPLYIPESTSETETDLNTPVNQPNRQTTQQDTP